MTSQQSLNQNTAIDFLSKPASYGLIRDTVERVDTHCSIVFLAGDYAYKLKRAIRFASLDYTTIEARKAAVQAELILNRRTAPDLYLATRTISHGDDGRVTFDGTGPTLDYVVVMRRFDQTGLFDALERKGRLTAGLMREVGEMVAQFHVGAQQMPKFGGSEAIARVIVDNERELNQAAPLLGNTPISSWGNLARAALTRLGPLLDRRREDGKVRRCHGDLRLANICLWNGRPTLFDCIEFSDDISCIDVLYDLAFLLMDLKLRDRDDLARATLDAYLKQAPEWDGVPAMQLFLSLRAATRAYALANAARRRRRAMEAARLAVFAQSHMCAAVQFLAGSASGAFDTDQCLHARDSR